MNDFNKSSSRNKFCSGTLCAPDIEKETLKKLTALHSGGASARSAHFAINKLFRNRIRYSGFERKIPEYSRTSECSIMHIPNHNTQLTSFVIAMS